MGKEEDSIITSSDNINHVLEWQLYTYHHIQNLATGILGAVFSALAIIITLLTAFRSSIPGVPWNQISANSEYGLIFGYSLVQPFAQVEITLNWIIAYLGFVLAGTILAEAVYFFGAIVTGDRLSHLANGSFEEMVSLPSEILSSLPVSDSLAASRTKWIVANSDQTDRADELLRHGLYRLPLALILSVYFIYIYFLSVEASMNAILIGHFNIIFFSILVLYAIWDRDREWRISRPTAWLWAGQVILAFIGLALLAYGVQ